MRLSGLTLLTSLLLLASCAQSRIEGSVLLDRAAPELRRSIALGEFPRERLHAVLIARGRSGTFFRNARNGDHVTWRAADDSAIVMRDGLLTATFGLGFDLLSADVSDTLFLIAQRQNGMATRIHRYLDGENQVVARAFRCDVAWEEGLGAVWRVREDCRGANITFENHYDLATDGRIVSSMQWVGPDIGAVRLSSLEPGATGPIIAVLGN